MPVLVVRPAQVGEVAWSVSECAVLCERERTGVEPFVNGWIRHVNVSNDIRPRVAAVGGDVRSADSERQAGVEGRDLRDLPIGIWYT